MEEERCKKKKTSRRIGHKSKATDEYLWQDREIRFDIKRSHIECRIGETIHDILDDVEDTKGNMNEKGRLIVTNLRIIWISDRNKNTNMAIGLKCITDISTSNLETRIKGAIQTLHILTKFSNARYEFIFTSLSADSPKLYENLNILYKKYNTTKNYRDLVLKSILLDENELILMENEDLYSKIDGVCNLAADEGNLGIFFITNIRIIWSSSLSQNFNISIPYIQIKEVKIRDSRFGSAFVIQTRKESGAYVLGFKIDPHEKLEETLKLISSIWQGYSKSPNFGLNMKNIFENDSIIHISKIINDEDNYKENYENKRDIISLYCAENDNRSDGPPVYCRELGLAIEELRDCITISDLRKIE